MAAYSPASQMLSEFTSEYQGDVAAAIHLHSGSSGAALQSVRNGTEHVFHTDRYLPSFLAATRLLQLERPSVVTLHTHGCRELSLTMQAQLATIRMPNDKLSAQQLIHDAFESLAIHGTCAIAGANNEGIKSAIRTLDTVFGNSQTVIQHSSSRLAIAVKETDSPGVNTLADNRYLEWDNFHSYVVNSRGTDWNIFTRPGVFSWEHHDEATGILAETISVDAGESVLDLGCGSGLPGLVAARLSETGHVVLLDADSEAVRCARHSAQHAQLSNVSVMASDVASAIRDEKFDVVISNPPFHAGKSVSLELPQRFISDARSALVTGGRFYLVANRTLPYERIIKNTFGEVRTIYDGNRFKVLSAVAQTLTM